MMIDEAKYLYSIASCGEFLELGQIGLEESLVYTIPCRDIAAIVHSCDSIPYGTEDKKLAEGWILEHAYVIDQATKRFGTVLPFSFDVIIRGDDHAAEQWLSRNYEDIKSELDRVKGKSEYSVQIFYDHAKLASECMDKDQDVGEIAEEIERAGRGRGYLLQKKLNMKINDKVSQQIIGLSDGLMAKIRALSDDIKTEKRKASDLERNRGMSLMASLACLVREENVALLGSVLDEINNLDGFAVRFTGPWAPFSFCQYLRGMNEAGER